MCQCLICSHLDFQELDFSKFGLIFISAFSIILFQKIGFSISRFSKYDFQYVFSFKFLIYASGANFSPNARPAQAREKIEPVPQNSMTNVYCPNLCIFQIGTSKADLPKRPAKATCQSWPANGLVRRLILLGWKFWHSLAYLANCEHFSELANILNWGIGLQAQWTIQDKLKE